MATETLTFETNVDLQGLEAQLEEVREEIEDAVNQLSQLSSEFGDAQRQAADVENETEDIEGNIDSISNMDLGDLGLEGMGEDAGFATDELGSFGGAIGRAASSLGSGAVAAAGYATAVGAVGVAAASATNEVAQWAGEVAQVGQQLEVAEAQSGVAAEEIEELFLVAQRLDSSIELDTIRDAFKEISLRVTEAREGTGEAAEAFDRLGISMSEIEGMNTAEIFNRIRKEAQGLTAQQRALTLEQIAGGEAGEKLARVFNLTEEEYRSLQSAVASESLTEEQIQQFDEMSRQLTRINQDYRDIENQLALTFGPPALQLVEAFTKGVQALSESVSDVDLRGFFQQFAGMPGPLGHLGTIMALQFDQAKQAQEGLWDDQAVDAYAQAVNGASEETSSSTKAFSEVKTELERIDALVENDVIPSTEQWRRKTDAVKNALMNTEPNTKAFEELLKLLNSIEQQSQNAFEDIGPTEPAQEVEPAPPEDLETGEMPSTSQLPAPPPDNYSKSTKNLSRMARWLTEIEESFAGGLLPDMTGEQGKLNAFGKKMKSLAEDSFQARSALRTLSNFGSRALSQLASSAGQSLGKVIAGVSDFEDFGKQLLKTIADLMKQVASALISLGSAMVLAPGLQGPGAAYLAAGAALMTAASALSGAVSKGSGGEEREGGAGPADTVGLAEGGVTIGEGMARLHENEVVRDKKVDDQLFRSALESDGGQQTLETRVRGEELLILLDKTKRKNRLGGL